MPNRSFIDTLFVIALINRRDQYHQQAIDLAEQFEGDPLLVTGTHLSRDTLLPQLLAAMA